MKVSAGQDKMENSISVIKEEIKYDIIGIQDKISASQAAFEGRMIDMLAYR